MVKIAEKLVDKATQPKALLGMAAFGIVGGVMELALAPTLVPTPGKIGTIIGGAAMYAGAAGTVEGLLAATPIPTPMKIVTATAGVGAIVPTPDKALGTLAVGGAATALVVGAPIPTPGKAAATFIGGAMAHLGPLVALGAVPIIAKGLAAAAKKITGKEEMPGEQMLNKLPGMSQIAPKLGLG